MSAELSESEVISRDWSNDSAGNRRVRNWSGGIAVVAFAAMGGSAAYGAGAPDALQQYGGVWLASAAGLAGTVLAASAAAAQLRAASGRTLAEELRSDEVKRAPTAKVRDYVQAQSDYMHDRAQRRRTAVRGAGGAVLAIGLILAAAAAPAAGGLAIGIATLGAGLGMAVFSMVNAVNSVVLHSMLAHGSLLKVDRAQHRLKEPGERSAVQVKPAKSPFAPRAGRGAEGSVVGNDQAPPLSSANRPAGGRTESGSRPRRQPGPPRRPRAK
ncbi:hypothetical protein [Nocardiopsis coralliicola]